MARRECRKRAGNHPASALATAPRLGAAFQSVTVSFQARSPGAPTSIWRLAAGLLLLAAMLWLCAIGAGPVPPLGALLDPATGVWSMPSAAELPRSAEARVPGLSAPVSVIYDDRMVPHVFAARVDDAYRALGFVVARDRLFQLEMQTLAASGRLTEVAGLRALPHDREMRTLGLPRAAEQRLAALAAGSPERVAVDAFADGVNAYIAAMTPAELPFEYRLLGRRPSRWESVNTLHLFNRMAWTLSYDAGDLDRLAARALVGAAAGDALYPVRAPIQEPIQPNGAGRPRYDFTRLPPPGAPDSAAAAMLATARTLQPAALRGARAGQAVGSNNWAVAAARTRAGRTLLAGDPHLELTLPSIWYEVQLRVPDALDVYGVTIPGLPAVVIGFNRDIAWTFTNTQADAVDYYEEIVDDAARPTRYRLDGVWRNLEPRVERFHDRRGRAIATDTVRYTHRGPLRRVGDAWYSMRWTALESGNAVGALLKAAEATNVTGFRRATGDFGSPAQNMLVADRAGSIAIRSTGSFPLRPGDGRGDVVRDGSTASADWTGEWTEARMPGAVNPAQGFLASANQQPIDPAVDPTYLGSHWYSPWRAMRINELLRGDAALTPDRMRAMQTDPGSARADHFVPLLRAAAARRPGRAECARASALLGEWDRRYTRQNRRAVLFEAVMRDLAALLWDELRGVEGDRPADQVIAQLAADSGSVWWDDRRTPVLERRDDLLCGALESGLAATISARGEPGDIRWRWDRVRFANVRHLLRLSSLSALRIPMQGGPSTLNPSSGGGSYGASWRMVVELGTETRGWGTYPGGQSGNPLSGGYKDRLAAWTEGRLDTLRFPRRPEDLPGTSVRSWLTLQPSPR